jgi:hypothetical protein
MTLSELYYSKPRPLTDKGECHDYIDSYYTNEFADKRNVPLNILEIGLYKGGSAELWSEWFLNAKLYGIEILPLDVPNMDLYIGDAYTEEALARFDGILFDYIIDDGPHTFESQMTAISLWGQRLQRGGKLIIEDVQSIDWVPSLVANAQKYSFSTRVFDLRNVKNRYDDIIVEITHNG